MKVYFATDHAGFEMKNALLAYARDELLHEVEDCGAFEYEKEDDYTDFVSVAARKLQADMEAGLDSRAVVAGASGQGEAMMANRFTRVRCGVYYGDPGTTQTDMSGKKLDILISPREHQNANCLSLGLRFLTLDQAKAALAQWLSAPFEGEERHVRRIHKLDTLA